MNKTNNSRRNFIKNAGKICASSAFMLGKPAVAGTMSSTIRNLLLSDGKSTPNNTQNNVVLTETDKKEYGTPEKLDLAYLGLTQTKKYSFIVMADPQGGDPNINNKHGRIGPTNERIKLIVQSINREPVQPDFVMVVGDVVDDEAEEEHFEMMHSLLSEINAPILYEMGNHETPYPGNPSTPGIFYPGDEENNFQLLSNYILAQKKMSGINRICYSFDVGDVHFIVFPNPIRPGFFETYPVFDWLEQDLRAHRDQPVMFFHHSPVVPTGHAGIVSYSEEPPIKRRTLELLASHGNVKYAMSGHVHIPFKSSVKTARVYNGTTYINLPTGGIGARNFGEPDVVSPPSVGYAVVHVDGTKIDMKLKHFDDDILLEPQTSDFNPDDFKLWFYDDWELPPFNELQNGDFNEGLNHWSKYFIYMQDKDPSITQNVIKDPQKTSALELYIDKDVPYGNAVTFNQVSQMIDLQDKNKAYLNFEYKINGRDILGNAGGVVSVALYSGEKNLGKIVYCFGKAYGKLDGVHTSPYDYFHYRCDYKPDAWNKGQINIADDIALIQGKRKSRLSLKDADKVKITLQAWTRGKNWKTLEDSQIRIKFADVSLSDTGRMSGSSFAGQKPVLLKTDQVMQW
jgi:3',5'-cyclic AMP phosphodiesterase CpdA